MSLIASKKLQIPLYVAAALTLASGLAHGWLDGRWESKPNLEAIAAKLKELPTQFGDWSLVENQELPESAQEQLKCYGYCLQVYQNSKSGRRLTVAVLFGPRGPIAVHTPEICYSGQGITPATKRTREVIETENGEHSLWRVSLFSKRDAKPELDALYAWSDGRNLQAAQNPRVRLTSRLYKIQLACPPSNNGEVSDALLFLHQFLPKLQPLLVETT